MELIGVTDTNIVEDSAIPGGLAFERTQVFPDSYWDGLQWARSQQTRATRCKDFHKVADIPAVFVELWLRRDGFNVWREPLKEIVKKLHREHLTDFITTERRV